MATIIPIAYNTGSTISGTEQIGDLAIGTTAQDYSTNIGGVKWWASPDLDLQYVIGYVDLSGTHPNPISFVPCHIGFWGSGDLTENSFINLCNFQFNQSFGSGNDAKVWLNSNGYWTNFNMGVTPLPTSTPTLTPAPTSTPTPLPTDTPTPEPTSTPNPTDTPTPEPTSTPTQLPTDTPTPLPATNTPTPEPTSTPTPTPGPTCYSCTLTNNSSQNWQFSGNDCCGNYITNITLMPGEFVDNFLTTDPYLYTIVDVDPTNIVLYDCFSATSTPTPLPTDTPTPEPTSTPTQLPTDTPTPEPTSTPTPTPTSVIGDNLLQENGDDLLQENGDNILLDLVGYPFNLVVLPYTFPSSGNTIINNIGGIITGDTNPNVFDDGSRGLYWNDIDSDGVDRSSYFSQFTGQSVTITMTQGSSTVIYSGDTNSLKYWVSSSPTNTGFVFGKGIGVPPSNTPSGDTVLIQSGTTWTVGQPVYISVTINV